MEEVPNFQLFSSQNSDLYNQQLDEIRGRKLKRKTPREQLSGEK